MAEGVAVEIEKLGRVALIGVLVVPGLSWISKGKTAGGMTWRAVVVGAVLAGALVLESTLDKAAEDLV